MSELEQQLRELSKEAFESLVHQLLMFKYPGAGIKRVDGTGGDQGIDSFWGELSRGPIVWQCKHFTTRIRKPQKQQIKKSIRAAFENRPLSRWILCLPINLRTSEHDWFQAHIVGAHGGAAAISLMQASDIVDELINNRPLRDAFFPVNAITTVLKVREIAMNTEGATTAELGRYAAEHAQQYLSSSVNLDPRLRAVVAIGGDRQERQAAHQQGLVMSLSEGDKTTHFFARDPRAFNLDPIRFSVTTKYQRRLDLEKALDLGLPFKLSVGELSKIDVSSPLLRSLFEGTNPANFEFEVRPALPRELARTHLPLRLVAGHHQESVEIAYLSFKITRAGRRRITFVSEGTLPAEITLWFQLGEDLNAGLSIRPIVQGAKARDLHHVLQFLDEVRRSGEIEIFSLETAEMLFRGSRGLSDDLTIGPELRRIIRDAAIVSNFFGRDLCIPEKIYKKDLEALVMLTRIATGEDFFDVNVNSSLVKDLAFQSRVLEAIDGGQQSIRLVNPNGWDTFIVFNQQIASGPVTLEGHGVTLISPSDTRQAYLAAPEGAAVPWNMHCHGPCRLISGLAKSFIDPRTVFSKSGMSTK